MVGNDHEALTRYASDRIHARLQEASQDALADQLFRTSANSGLLTALRLRTADGLRALACQLDPTVVCEPALRLAVPR
jgi:hypothetical protein